MNWFKKIISTPVKIDHREEYFGAWQRISHEIESRVISLLPSIQKNWMVWSGVEDQFSEDEWKTAVESCLWAVYFLKMVKEIEDKSLPQTWVGEILELVMQSMDENGKGCRIRYSRGMLQEFAESGRSINTKDLQSYFGEWLFNANGKSTGHDVSRETAVRIGQEVLRDESLMVWGGVTL